MVEVDDWLPLVETGSYRTLELRHFDVAPFPTETYTSTVGYRAVDENASSNTSSLLSSLYFVCGSKQDPYIIFTPGFSIAPEINCILVSASTK